MKPKNKYEDILNLNPEDLFIKEKKKLVPLSTLSYSEQMTTRLFETSKTDLIEDDYNGTVDYGKY